MKENDAKIICEGGNDMPNLVKVSVIIPTYNRGEALCNTIDSILKNDYDNFEVIVVDQTQDYPEEINSYIINLVLLKKNKIL